MTSATLSLEPARCDGVGICVLVAPDLVTLDEWGFPLINEDVEPSLMKQARAAAKACPHRALSTSP